MKEKNVRHALKAFETVVEAAQARHAAAEAEKDRLQQCQLELVQHAQELVEPLGDPTMLEPWAFRLRETRLKRLEQRRKETQNALSEAAIAARDSGENLRSALRSRATLEIVLDNLRKASARTDDTVAEALALFELGKRR